MQSISRAFRDYFDLNINKDKIVNNIILGQACRHVIVHSGNIIDAKLLKQVSNAKPRDIMETLRINEELRFTPEELTVIGDSMKEYISMLNTSLYEIIS